MALDLKPYSLKQMQDLVRHSVSVMEKRHKRWRLLEALYRTGSLEQASNVKTGELSELMPMLDQHIVNLVLPHINIILSSVVSREPQFIATPIAGGEEAEKNAEVSRALINYFWQRLRVTRELRDATADAVKLGSGFLKVGWTHLEEETELSERDRETEAINAFERGRLDAILKEEEFSETVETLQRSVPHSEMRVIRSEPFVEYVSPYDIFFPANARRIDDSRWVVHRLSLPVDEILANPEFDVNEDTIVRDGTAYNATDEYQAEWRRQSEDSEGIYANAEALDTATIWEFYDMRTRKLSVFQIGRDEPLWEGDLPWSHRNPPFVHIRNFTTAGHDFWGFGDLENVANLQHMLNEFITEQIENARRAGQKYLIRKDAVTDELMAALESPEADVVAPVDIPNGEPLEQVIIPVFRQALSGDLYAAKTELEGYMQKVMGINEFQSGGLGADRMSATAAAVVEGVATLRAQDKITSIENGAAQVGNLVLLLCQEYLDEPTAIRIAGDEEAIWPEVSKDDLYGEFIVTVEGGSLRSLNPATREQQGIRLLNEVVPVLQAMGFDPEPALRQALRSLGFKPDEMLIPMPQPEVGMEGGGEIPTGPTAGIEGLGGPPTAQQAQSLGGLTI